MNEKYRMVQRLKQFEENGFKTNIGGWRDGSEVKNTSCSIRGPESNSQQPHGGSQLSIMGFSALFWPAGTQTEHCLHNK